MYMLLALLAWAFATETPTPGCVERVVKSVQVVLMIDGSGSVALEDFPTQVRLANGVLNSIREMYNEINKDGTATLSWAALQFAQDVVSIREMHVDEGPQDGISEDLDRMCSIYNRRDYATCGTKYQPVLNEAKSLFVPGQSKRFLWFLTDGEAYDITSARAMKQFRESFNGDDSMAIECVYLTPDASSITPAKAVLQALACPTSDPECTDHVLTGHVSTDMTVFSSKTQNMTRKLVEEFVSSPCPTSSTTSTTTTTVSTTTTTTVSSTTTTTTVSSTTTTTTVSSTTTTTTVSSSTTTTTVSSTTTTATVSSTTTPTTVSSSTSTIATIEVESAALNDETSLAMLAAAVMALLACLICCCCICGRKKKTPLVEEEESRMRQVYDGRGSGLSDVYQPRNSGGKGARTRGGLRKSGGPRGSRGRQ